MAEGIVIGVDGGGTGCRARLAVGGTARGEGTGGPANVRLDPRGTMRAILDACRSAATAAGLGEAAVYGATIGLGLAGASQRDACEALLAEPHPFARIVIDTDAFAAWRGAFGGSDGGILILGTGSCGFAVVAGTRHYVGGWGAELSDEASGAAIGREALRRMLWAHDGRLAPTPLTEALFARFGRDPERVVGFATHARPRDIAGFTPLVFEHAGSGDPVAGAILTDAAAAADAIIDRLAALGARRIALFGGVAASLRPWLAAPAAAEIVAPQGDAMDGALALARDAALGEAAE